MLALTTLLFSVAHGHMPSDTFTLSEITHPTSRGSQEASRALGSANPRPQLPHCKCLDVWPYSDDEKVFTEQYFGTGTLKHPLFGQGMGGYGMEVPFGTRGCFDLGTVYGFTANDDKDDDDALLICVPDLSDGPCIGYGYYQPFTMAWLMACTDTTTNAVKELTGEALRAAQVAEFVYKDAKSAPPCECVSDEDMANSEIAELYCGDKAHLLKDGATTHEACATLPVRFEAIVLESTEAQVGKEGTVYPLLNKEDGQEGQSWCKVQTTACAASDIQSPRIEPCTGEKFMVLPNDMIGQQDPLSQNLHIQNQFGLAALMARMSAQVSPAHIQTPSDPDYAILYTATTFMPQNAVPSLEDLYDESGGDDCTETRYGLSKGWEDAMAAAAKTYAKYDQPALGPACDSDCKLKDFENKAEVKQQEEDSAKKCDSNAECAAKKRANSCQMTMKKTVEATCGYTPPQCTDLPSGYMQKNGKECASSGWFVRNNCKNNARWVKNNYCQESCHKAGLGYTADSPEMQRLCLAGPL